MTRASSDQVIHAVSHYLVTYETISEAGQPVLKSSRLFFNVSANSRQLPLDGLETYTACKIKVESIGLDGKVQKNKVLLVGLYISLIQVVTNILNAIEIFQPA